MAEKISVQIALEGGAEVEKQLADIGETGAKAFDDVKQAGTTAADGIAKAGDASQKTAEGLNQIEGSAASAAESLSHVSLESIKTGAEIAKVGLEITKLGVEIGLAVARHRTLAQSLLHMVSGASTAVKAIGLLAPELTAVAAAIAPVAVAVAGAVVAFEAIEKAATKAAAGFEKINHSLQMLSTETGQSFNSLQQGQEAFEQLGIKAEAFGGIIRKAAETMGGADLGGALKKSADDADAALLQVRQAQDALFQSTTPDQFIAAQKLMADAAEKTAVVAANSIGKIVEQVKALEAGQKGVTFDPLVKSETIIKAVGLSMKEVADQGGNATQVLQNFIVNADKMTAIKVGAAFGITAEDVDRIKRLGTAVGNIKISPEATAAFERMRTAIAANEQASVRLRQALSFPDFAASAARLSGDLNIIGAAVTNLAANAVNGFSRFVSGAAQLESVKQVTQDLQNVINNFSWGTFASAAMSAGSALGWVTPAGLAAKAMGAAFGSAAPAIQQTGQAAAQAGQKIEQSFASNEAIAARMAQAAGRMYEALQQASSVSPPKPPDPTPWQMIKNGVTDAATAIGAFASKLAGITWDAISSVGVTAWNGLTGAIEGAASAVANFFSNLAAGAWDKVKALLGISGGAPATGGGAPGKARGGLLGGRGTGTSDSNLAWVSRGEYITPARVVRQPGVLAFLEALRRSGRIPGFAQGGTVGGASVDFTRVQSMEQIAQAINSLAQSIADGFNVVAKEQTLTQGISTILEVINGLAQQQGELVKSFNDLMQYAKANAKKAASDVIAAPPNARGGLLGGRGTGTSDSNLAWVSRGEHIMPARAVRQPGVLAFLELLRRSGGDLRRVLDGMGRFALGGMIRGPIPAFASGGLAGGMSNVTIQFPGLPAIGGLRASSDVVDQLHRAAALAQVRSGGRKPSRYS